MAEKTPEHLKLGLGGPPAEPKPPRRDPDLHRPVGFHSDGGWVWVEGKGLNIHEAANEAAHHLDLQRLLGEKPFSSLSSPNFVRVAGLHFPNVDVNTPIGLPSAALIGPPADSSTNDGQKQMKKENELYKRRVRRVANLMVFLFFFALLALYWSFGFKNGRALSPVEAVQVEKPSWPWGGR